MRKHQQKHSIIFYKSIFLLIVFLTFSFLTISQNKESTMQINIPRIEMMPNIPQPFKMIDWKQKVIDYDAFVFNFNLKGKYLPVIWWDKTHTNIPRDTFGLPSYVGRYAQETKGNNHEAIACMSAVLGATIVGIDKSNQNGHNWVLMMEQYYNTATGENLVLNNIATESGQSFWYELFPHIIFYALADKYPGVGKLREIMLSTADKWAQAVYNMGGKDGVPNFDYTAFNFKKMKPVDNEEWKEPDASAAIAWLEYMAYIKSGDKKYLTTAEKCMQSLDERFKNPYYESLLPYGVYIAARMNAELGKNYDVEKFFNWCFEPTSYYRWGWGVCAENWGGYDCHGLVGSVTDGGGYVFTMNTFAAGGAIVPIARYDDRFARAIGKWMLNVANAARLFYPDGLSLDHQTNKTWKGDPKGVIAYEGLRKIWEGKSPYACGDAVRDGWGPLDLCLYGSSFVGFFGGIISKTNDERIIRLDCRATDYFQSKAYPTYLYYNPYNTPKTVEVDIGNNTVDIYDTVSNQFIRKAVKERAGIDIPSDSAVVLVLCPVGGEVTYDKNKTLVNGIVIDYNNGKSPLLEPVKRIRKIPVISEDDASRIIKAPKADIIIDGKADDWGNLKCDSLHLDTSAKGNLQCNVKFAWNNEYLFILVTEGKGDTVAKEANSGEAFLSPWEYDSISFFIDIDNSNDREAFGDFNLWLGFSSAGHKDLYASLSNLPRNISRDYLSNIKVKTSGNQKHNNRIIEAAISWQGISDNIDDLFEPEQNLTKAVRPGLRFGCEPLLVDDSYEKQSFIGGEKRPGGKDKNSIDILLIQ